MFGIQYLLLLLEYFSFSHNLLHFFMLLLDMFVFESGSILYQLRLYHFISLLNFIERLLDLHIMQVVIIILQHKRFIFTNLQQILTFQWILGQKRVHNFLLTLDRLGGDRSKIFVNLVVAYLTILHHCFEIVDELVLLSVYQFVGVEDLV